MIRSDWLLLIAGHLLCWGLFGFLFQVDSRYADRVVVANMTTLITLMIGLRISKRRGFVGSLKSDMLFWVSVGCICFSVTNAIFRTAP